MSKSKIQDREVHADVIGNKTMLHTVTDKTQTCCPKLLSSLVSYPVFSVFSPSWKAWPSFSSFQPQGFCPSCHLCLRCSSPSLYLPDFSWFQPQLMFCPLSSLLTTLLSWFPHTQHSLIDNITFITGLMF